MTLVILASQESVSTHFKAEYIHFHMNGVSAGVDSSLEHSNKPSQTRRWSRLKPNCYGWRQQKQDKTR